SASPQFFTPCVLQGGVSGGPGGSLGGILCLAVSEPSPGIPQFMSTGYLDGIPFVLLRQRRGRVELLTRVDGEWSRAEHWERKTQTLRGMASVETRNLETARGGPHTRLWVYGCDLLSGREHPWIQVGFAYDGRDHISFDPKSGEIHVDKLPEAQCPELLRNRVGYRQKELGIRWNAPDVHVSGTRGHRDADPILPRGVQFYPNTIAVSWMKGGETLDQETGGRDSSQQRRHLPHLGQDRGRFPEPTSGGNLTVVVAVSVIAAILILTVLIGFSIWRLQSGMRDRNGYNPAAGKDVGTNGLSTGTEQDQGGIPEGDWAGWMDWDQ
uniref:MHC class I-like antigen recognition-like domain-containing protein n=1 Tax=Geospiza parvula TaxID=87175 RepID=A0A8U8CEZ9_GEOPR